MEDQALSKVGLDLFLSRWKSIHEAGTPSRRLRRFLDQASPLLTRRAVARPVRSIDAQTLRPITAALSHAMARRRRSGGTINPWSAAGLKRLEVRNAAALTSLWSVAQCGDVARRFLAEFLNRVASRGGSLPDEEELARGYLVRSEHSPDGNGRERVDITLETDGHLVGIEVKIDAGEGSNQLSRYVATVARSAEAVGKRSAVILLAPFAPSHPNVLSADWSLVRAAASAVTPARASDNTFADRLVVTFAKHAHSF